jgi:hypothetical protein
MKLCFPRNAWLFAIFLCTTHAAQAGTLRYQVFASDGKQAGEQIVEQGAGGRITVRFGYKENGRGPDVVEQLRVAADGTLTEYSVKGAATMGGPIDERFTRSGNQAQWQSLSEKGSTQVKGAAMYVPLNSSFHFSTLTMQALAKAKGAALPLLPSGTLTQRRLATATVKNGTQTRQVQLLAQTGLGFTPALMWATVEPTPRLFAVIYPGWLSVIEQGWQGSREALLAEQLRAENALLKGMAAKLRAPLPGLTVVRNARVFDSEKAVLGEPADVYVLRGRITAVVPTGTLKTPVNHEVDAAGRVLLPGLFDMHAHVDRWDGGLHLAAGVTTARDMGNDNEKLQGMLTELNAGQLLSPHIVPCGFLEGESPNAARSGFVIKTLQEAKDAVDWYAAHGYPQLKIYNSFPREMVRDIVAYAHARGLRVSGHIPVFMRAQEAVEQGYDEIQHINQVLLNFLVSPTTDTRTLERFYLPAEKVAGLDFESKEVRDFLALLKQRNVSIDPTVSTFDFIKQRDGELAAPYAAIATHLPTNVQRGLRTGGMKIPDDATAARYKASYDKMIEFIGRMHRAGIDLVAGTDAMAGFTLHSELELYVKAGLTPAQALQVATRNGAKYSGVAHERGHIAPGKVADLVLVEGDPTQNISDIRKVALVITQGHAISPAQVYQTLGVKPFVQNPPVVKTIAAPAKSAGGGTAGHRHGHAHHGLQAGGHQH